MVVFPFGLKGKRISDKLIQTADGLGLPLIQMPDDADYSDAIDSVMDRVLYGDNFGNSLISNTIFHLLNFEQYFHLLSKLYSLTDPEGKKARLTQQVLLYPLK